MAHRTLRVMAASHRDASSTRAFGDTKSSLHGGSQVDGIRTSSADRCFWAGPASMKWQLRICVTRTIRKHFLIRINGGGVGFGRPFGAVGRSGSAAIGAGRTGLAWMVNSIGAFVRELPRSERWVIWTNRCSLVDNAGIARYVPWIPLR